jgi:hypothetical protein
MHADTLEINGFTITIEVVKIIPPMSFAKYEAKVTRIYDQDSRKDLRLTSDNCKLAWAKTADLAYGKVRTHIGAWTKTQRLLGRR